jgi:cell division protein FtsB
MGRYSSHQACDAARQRERVAREGEKIERREAVLREEIASLQNRRSKVEMVLSYGSQFF